MKPGAEATPDEILQMSIVIPCLNEAETIATVVSKALQGLADAGLKGEVIVADNGSTDGSRELAEQHGARVVPVPQRGYGMALQGGIAAARGKWILMGDADDSYDFLQIPRFAEKMNDGHELVMGCRLASGGGTVLPGAMPFLHRWWGNPMFSLMARWMFRYPGHDVYCGMRAFQRALPERLALSSPGMEYAVEMVLKSAAFDVDIAEVPITLHPDGRRLARPHLRTFRDGWRTLRLFLAFSPSWLYLLPAVLLLGFGALCYALALPGLDVAGLRFDVHTLLVGSLGLILGFQALLFALAAQIAASEQRLIPKSMRVERMLKWLALERVLWVSALACTLGLAGIVALTLEWQAIGFGKLDYARSMRALIPSVTLAAIGAQAFLGGFFISQMQSWRDYAVRQPPRP